MTPGVEFDDQNDIAEYVCGRAENVQDHNGQDRDHDDQDHDHLHLYHLLLIETILVRDSEWRRKLILWSKGPKGDLVSLWT